MFLENGYLDIAEIMGKNMVFNAIVTGRAAGKTYGVLQWALQNNIVIMFMRRTQTQLDTVTTDAYNPFAPLNEQREDGGEWRFVRHGKGSIELWNHLPDEEGNLVKVGTQPLGYGAALSTVRNLKGFSANRVQLIIFDEFIPLPGERAANTEASDFWRGYETINRNRELQGAPPVRVLFLGNANNRLGCNLLLDMGIAAAIAELDKSGREYKIIPQKSMGVWYLKETPITRAKADTAMYRAAGEAHVREALNNEIGDEHWVIQSQPLSQYRPWLSIGNICIYKRKGGGDFYYVTPHVSGTPQVFGTSRAELIRFRPYKNLLRIMSLRRKIVYESRICAMILADILDLT